MARKSAYEDLRKRLEDGADGAGDTEVNIEVVVNADADAAEDIIDAGEVGAAEVDADVAADTEEAVQQESEDLAEMAAILREHGLTPGMAALIQTTVPLDYYQISMPATESMDMAGRNSEYADRLAAAFEEASDSFWSSTKNFFKKAWQWIKDLCVKVASMLGNLEGRVTRMGKVLSKRQFASERNKDKKYKQWEKQPTSDDILKAYNELHNVVANAKVISESTAAADNVDTEDKMRADVQSKLSDTTLSTIGVKWKEKEKSLKLEDVSGFFDTKDETITDDTRKAFAEDGAQYKFALECVRLGKKLRVIAGDAEKNIAQSERDYGIDAIGKDKDDKTVKARRARIKTARTFVTSFQKAISRATKVVTFGATNYLKGGRAVLGCTKGEGGADYKD